MVFKTKKKKKSKNQRGNNSYGHGARKKWKGSGHHGGVGMAGTGKRADHKKSLVIKLYGNNYFGKQGMTSKSTKHKKANVMNLNDIQKNLDSLMKKYGKNKELILKNYKILGEGELNLAVKIKARAFSESAKEKIEKAGGEAIALKKEEKVEEKEEAEK
ncbi:MAG: uL15 family ribosomal protein [Nanoarchaeota archaeon]